MSNKSLSYWLVYHNTDPDTMFSPQPHLWQSEKRDCYFHLVALVQAATLQDVYRLTNHIDYDWRENEQVKAVALPPPRSTSVGDVIVRSGTGTVTDTGGEEGSETDICRNQKDCHAGCWMVDVTGFRCLG